MSKLSADRRRATKRPPISGLEHTGNRTEHGQDARAGDDAHRRRRRTGGAPQCPAAPVQGPCIGRLHPARGLHPAARPILAVRSCITGQRGPRKLARELPRASMVWIGDVTISAATGFFVACYLLDLDLAPSLTAAVALTATSVGVSVGAWQEAGKLNSPSSHLLLDVRSWTTSAASFSWDCCCRYFRSSKGETARWAAMGANAMLFLAEFALFAGGCLLFGRYLEGRLVHWSAHRTGDGFDAHCARSGTADRRRGRVAGIFAGHRRLVRPGWCSAGPPGRQRRGGIQETVWTWIRIRLPWATACNGD